MAHERLRFNIVLKEQNEPNENRVSNTSFDPIYSDTKYNTHYGIYANFSGQKSGNSFVTSNIHFWLQNYTGEVSIGLSKVIGVTDNDVLDSQDDYFVDGFSTGRHVKIYLLLQGLSNKSEDDYSEPLTLNEGDFIEVITYFEPVDNALSQINEPGVVRNAKCRFADSEFMLRDGEDIVPADNLQNTLQRLQAIRENGLQGSPQTYNHGPRRTCKMKVSDVYIR